MSQLVFDLLPVFFLLGLGALIGRTGFFSAEMIEGLKRIVANIALPALLFVAFSRVHLDLWLVQVPDPTTPLEETASALAQAVASGRTRYVGLSNHPAWATVRVADILGAGGAGLAAAEVEHSLLNRGIERELLPAAAAVGLGVLGYAPLGRGVLTGRYRSSTPPDSRAASPHLRSYVAPYLAERHRGVVEAVATAAAGLDRKPVEVALAWARDAEGVSATVLGARTPSQLQGALAAEDLVLPVQIRHALDEVTAPALGYPERF